MQGVDKELLISSPTHSGVCGSVWEFNSTVFLTTSTAWTKQYIMAGLSEDSWSLPLLTSSPSSRDYPRQPLDGMSVRPAKLASEVWMLWIALRGKETKFCATGDIPCIQGLLVICYCLDKPVQELLISHFVIPSDWISTVWPSTRRTSVRPGTLATEVWMLWIALEIKETKCQNFAPPGTFLVYFSQKFLKFSECVSVCHPKSWPKLKILKYEHLKNCSFCY